MREINVTVTIPLRTESWKVLNNVSPDLKLVDASTLFNAEQENKPGAKEKLNAILADTEVIFGFRLPEGVLTYISAYDGQDIGYERNVLQAFDPDDPGVTISRDRRGRLTALAV